ncbi:WD40 repeat-like protein [Calocera viscosa TUFC12733]|uniref:WD40 repeat-like protein n=1 Tax=Calocera viscosa (strain TUFC12733) TaxID=1330018 RepID=A0A167LP70_CALVF|nr:WD40 repeat-like protein [Calocera viscosa TUFC12733]
MTATTTTFPTACELQVPSPVTCLDFLGELLAAGTEDGQIRIYALGDGTATLRNVISGTKEEIGSLAWAPRKGTEDEKRELWSAAGSQISRYEIGETSETPVANAAETIEPLKDEEDVISKITIDQKGSHLAYSTEDGVVCVISLTLERPKRVMRISHNSVCDCIAFLPPNHGLISAGYDYRIIQHDFSRGTLTSQLSLEQVTPTQATMSLSPPFIQSLHIAPNGDLACGLANGEVYIAPATKPGERKKDKKRRLAALAGHGVRHQAAEGPIVGLYHTDEKSLLACTLLGSLLHFRIAPIWELAWSETVGGVAKVNALACNDQCLAIGGVTADGKGLVVIKRLETTRGAGQ